MINKFLPIVLAFLFSDFDNQDRYITKYHENGKILCKGFWKGTLPAGRHIVYDSTGVIIEDYEFVNDKILIDNLSKVDTTILNINQKIEEDLMLELFGNYNTNQKKSKFEISQMKYIKSSEEWGKENDRRVLDTYSHAILGEVFSTDRLIVRWDRISNINSMRKSKLISKYKPPSPFIFMHPKMEKIIDIEYGEGNYKIAILSLDSYYHNSFFFIYQVALEYIDNEINLLNEVELMYYTSNRWNSTFTSLKELGNNELELVAQIGSGDFDKQTYELINKKFQNKEKNK